MQLVQRRASHRRRVKRIEVHRGHTRGAAGNIVGTEVSGTALTAAIQETDARLRKTLVDGVVFLPASHGGNHAETRRAGEAGGSVPNGVRAQDRDGLRASRCNRLASLDVEARNQPVPPISSGLRHTVQVVIPARHRISTLRQRARAITACAGAGQRDALDKSSSQKVIFGNIYRHGNAILCGCMRVL